jgi:hypothetical protein
VLLQRHKNKQHPPEHLWIQADNCTGANKNHVVLAFCGWLVATGVFKTVQLNCLLVGHTHEDIDAFFAVIATALKSETQLLVQCFCHYS